MTETDFFNMYIERILQEVVELTKIKMINETKILFLEKTNDILINKIKSIENETHLPEKKKTKKPDINMSGDTFNPTI